MQVATLFCRPGRLPAFLLLGLLAGCKDETTTLVQAAPEPVPLELPVAVASFHPVHPDGLLVPESVDYAWQGSLAEGLGGTLPERLVILVDDGRTLAPGTYLFGVPAPQTQLTVRLFQDVQTAGSPEPQPVSAARVFTAIAGQLTVQALGSARGEWQAELGGLLLQESNEQGRLVPGGQRIALSGMVAMDNRLTDPDGEGPLDCPSLALADYQPFTDISVAVQTLPLANIGLPNADYVQLFHGNSAPASCDFSSDGSSGCWLGLFKDERNFIGYRRLFRATTGTLTVTQKGPSEGMNASYTGVQLREVSGYDLGLLPGGACYSLPDAAFATAS